MRACGLPFRYGSGDPGHPPFSQRTRKRWGTRTNVVEKNHRLCVPGKGGPPARGASVPIRQAFILLRLLLPGRCLR